MTRYRAYALVIFSAVSLQSGSAVATTLFDRVDAPGLLALRTGLGALMLFVITRAWRTLPPRRSWPLVAAFGGAMGLMNLLFYLSLERIPLGVAVALELLGPLAVAVAGSQRARDLAWTAVAVLGVAVLVGPGVLDALGLAGGQPAASLDLLGVALAVGAGGCWALYILLGTRLSGVMAGAGGVAWAMVCASVLLVPLGVGTAGTTLLDPWVLLGGLVVAVLSSAVPYAVEMQAMRAVGAGTFGVMMATEPAVAALTGFVLAGQRLLPVTLVGIAMVVVAVLGALARPAGDPPAAAAGSPDGAGSPDAGDGGEPPDVATPSGALP